MHTMRAVVLHRTGGLKHLKLEEVPVPAPGAGEVLVRLKAAALNHRDVWIVQGRYANIQLPVILGSDGAGIVEQVGPGVDAALVGKAILINPSLNWGSNPRAQGKAYRILGMPDPGTHAEYIVVPAGQVVEKPDYLSFEEGAAIPLGGLTGYRALFTQGRLTAGETVLLTGIGGGVAALMFTMALAAGARVVVTSGSDEKLKRAVDAGAFGGANYRDPNWVDTLQRLTAPRGIDLIVDSAGGDHFSSLINLVNPGGRIVFFGATAGNPQRLDLRRIFWKQITLQGTTMGTEQDFYEMIRLFELHQIKPLVDRIFPIEAYPSAYQRMFNGEQFGKIVLTMGNT